MKVDENIEDDSNLEKKLDIFWKDSDYIVKHVPSGHSLQNVAKFGVIVKENCLPNGTLDMIDQEKKVMVLFLFPIKKKLVAFSFTAFLY